MDSRSPETFVRVDVSHATQDALVEEERFDTGAAPAQFRAEFFFGGFERIEAEFAQDGFVLAIFDDAHAAEAANVRVAEFAAIVEREKNVSVRHHRRFRRANDELPRHSQVNQQRGAAVIGTRGLKIQHQKFAVSADGSDPATGEDLLDRVRIVDEIGFAQANAVNSSSGQDCSQTARDGFNFGKLGHGMDWTLAHQTTMQNFPEESQTVERRVRPGENLS
jgi:hypothetical protein